MVDSYFHNLAAALQQLDADQLDALYAFVADCAGTLWLCGNGGSLATAQHWACDLSKAAGKRAQALGSNPAVLTAWANDNDYAGALGAELSRLARSGDALICISCSGASSNIHWALREAKARNLPVALLTSDLCPYDDTPDLIVRVPATHYGIIEDCHLAIGHWLTERCRAGGQ